jgi:vitamin B12/bleomycin/antimicrobial peptide transport system ATP-binding/permease protein
VVDKLDWSHQVLDSIWWVTWVSAVSLAGFAGIAWLIVRFTGWGKQVARLAWPYFRPGRTWLSWRPLATFTLLIATTNISVRFNVLASYVFNGVNTALQDLDGSAFLKYIGIFSIIAAANIVEYMFSYYLLSIFKLHWREALNKSMLGDWIAGDAYYRGQYTSAPVDNPDQRIQQDITSFIDNSQDLALGSVKSVVSLVSFSIVLWELSSPLHVLGLEIPRAMIIITYAYVIVATVIAFKVGHPLVRLSFLNEMFTASYRYGLVRTRDNAENIALQRGEQVEHATLTSRFGAVIKNYRALIYRGVKFQGFNFTIDQLSKVFPILVLAPPFFAGTAKLGDLSQASTAFTNVHDSMSFFRSSYDTFAGYRAVLDRLTGLLDVNAQARALPRPETDDRREGLAVRDLTVFHPSGQPMVRELNLELGSGDALVVKGGSGSGKTSLLRSLAGLWPYATGTVLRPTDGGSLFLSQQPYMPFGSLRTALAYPEPAESISDEHGREVLRQVFLGHLVDALNEDKPWWRILSPGEQQRIAFGRILINRPSVVFLDESTSSVDEGLEFALYELIREQLPDCTVFSVGHRGTLNSLHSHHLELLSNGEWSLQVAVRS